MRASKARTALPIAAAFAFALTVLVSGCAAPAVPVGSTPDSSPVGDPVVSVAADPSLDPMSEEAIQARIDALSDVQLCMFQVGGGPPVDAEAAAAAPDLFTRIQGLQSATLEARSDVVAGFNSTTPDVTNSTIVVNLAADDAEAAWDQVLAGSEALARYTDGLANEVTFIPVSVQFSFDQLCAAHHAIMAFAEETNGSQEPIIVGWGIDQPMNRVAVQVYEPMYTPEAEARVLALAPAGMLSVTKTTELMTW